MDVFGTAEDYCLHVLEAWSTNHSAVYCWMGSDDFAPLVVFLTSVDGSATAEVWVIHALVSGGWPPINKKYTATPESCLEVFLRA